MNTQTELLLAASATDTFLGTSIGKVLTSFAAAIAVVVITIGVLKMISSATKGEIGKGVKVLLSCLLIGALLIDLKTTVSFTSTLGSLISKFFSSSNTIIGAS